MGDGIRDLTDIERIQESIDKATETMKEISQELAILDRKTLWNRIVIVMLVLLMIMVIGLGIVFFHEARNADEQFRMALLANCNDTNDLKAKILEEERVFVRSLAEIFNAGPDRVEEFLNILAENRGDDLNPIDCREVIVN